MQVTVSSKLTVTFLFMTDILLLGTGALACLFAARLTQAGHVVTLLGTWRAGLEAIKANGVRYVDANGDEQRFNVHATDDPAECADATAAIVLVKAWQTERASHHLQACLAKDGLALTLQNGLGNYEMLVQHLGSERVALGTTTTGATLLGPGVVRVGGDGIISLGRNQALGPIEATFRSAGFNVKVVEDALSLVWGKLVINAAINPLTALLRVKNGELLERLTARALLGALAREAAQAAQAENITLPFDDPARAVEEVARKTAENHSSMLQDVLRGAVTEIDAICGAVVATAEKHGFDAPVNRTCWQLVKAL